MLLVGAERIKVLSKVIDYLEELSMLIRYVVEVTNIPSKVTNRPYTFKIVEKALDMGIGEQGHRQQEAYCIALLMPKILMKCLKARGAKFDHFVSELLYLWSWIRMTGRKRLVFFRITATA